MDWAYPPEAEVFRLELREWLAANVEDRFRGMAMLDPSAEDLALHREWLDRLAAAGYAAISWPAEYGGRDAGPFDQAVYAEEMAAARAPGHLNTLGISNIAPAILAYGTDVQKQHYLPRMARGDDVWCQGFSEPGAGSDLAGLSTAAVRDGDHYVVTGQKLWTTNGHVATHCELLVRTDPAAQKHRGISCLVVDLSGPGIERRPLVTATGDAEFAEMFFDGARVPADNLIGTENDGWRVAMTTLNHERGGVVALHLGIRRRIRDLVDLARTTPYDGTPASEHPAIRRELATVYLRGELLKLLSDRSLSAAAHGRATGPEAALGKLVWSDLEDRLAEAAAHVLGPDANGGEWGRARVYARAVSIAGGTTQVNKGVVATRVLGLPRG